MNEGLEKRVVRVSSAHIEALPFRCADEVWEACDQWLRKRGLQTDGEMFYEASRARRLANWSLKNSRQTEARRRERL